jgi:hypothetical protein
VPAVKSEADAFRLAHDERLRLRQLGLLVLNTVVGSGRRERKNTQIIHLDNLHLVEVDQRNDSLNRGIVLLRILVSLVIAVNNKTEVVNI